MQAPEMAALVVDFNAQGFPASRRSVSSKLQRGEPAWPARRASLPDGQGFKPFSNSFNGV